jgi:hypothetical protein
VGLRPVWIGAENLAPTGIRSPDLPAHSELLYLLRYPGPLNPMIYTVLNINFPFNLHNVFQEHNTGIK